MIRGILGAMPWKLWVKVGETKITSVHRGLGNADRAVKAVYPHAYHWEERALPPAKTPPHHYWHETPQRYRERSLQTMYGIAQAVWEPGTGMVQVGRGNIPTTMPPAKKPKTTSKPVPEITKTQFIRERSHLTPKEIKEEGKKAGVKLSLNMIYTIRSDTKKRAQKLQSGGGKAIAQASPASDAAALFARGAEVARQHAPRGRASAQETIQGELRRLAWKYGVIAVREALEEIELESQH